MKRKTIIALVIILLAILFWGASYLYCEAITGRFGASVYEDVADRISLPGTEIETFKLLSYRENKSTKIYYVTVDSERMYREGCTVILEWNDGRWEFTSRGVSGWSDSGSANDPIWPYALLPG